MTAQNSIGIFIAYHFHYYASQRTIYRRLVTLKAEPCEADGCSCPSPLLTSGPKSKSSIVAKVNQTGGVFYENAKALFHQQQP
jgi:hypothetical protein